MDGPWTPPYRMPPRPDADGRRRVPCVSHIHSAPISTVPACATSSDRERFMQRHATRMRHPGGFHDRPGHPHAHGERRPPVRRASRPARRPRGPPAHPVPPRLEACRPARRRGRGTRGVVGWARRPGARQHQLVRRGRGEEEAGAELLRLAPGQVELEINLPGGWRDDPALHAAAETRFTAARAAGYELLVERFLYRWTPDRGFPTAPAA